MTTRIASQAAEGGFLAAAREVTGAAGDRLRAEGADAAAEPADALTGFANREQFHFELERELARADLFGRPLSLLVIGLDNFKTLNDTHGLLAGDEYLRSMAETLRGTLQGERPPAAWAATRSPSCFPERPRRKPRRAPRPSSRSFAGWRLCGRATR